MMANGIVGKVLDKVSKCQAFDDGTPNRFIVGSVKKAMLKLDHKRKALAEDGMEDIPQTRKGGKYK